MAANDFLRYEVYVEDMDASVCRSSVPITDDALAAICRMHPNRNVAVYSVDGNHRYHHVQTSMVIHHEKAG